MKALLEPIKEIARFDELFRDLKKGTAGVTVISGCLESQKAHMIAGLSEDAPVRLLIATMIPAVTSLANCARS